jgi:hypothetical protein
MGRNKCGKCQQRVEKQSRLTRKGGTEAAESFDGKTL